MRNSTIKTRTRAEKSRRTRARNANPLRQAKEIVRVVEWIKKYDDGREVLNMETAEGLAEYKQRTYEMAKRQDFFCGCGCGQVLNVWNMTFDHESGRGLGGSRRDDRISLPNGELLNRALTYECNRRKGSVRGYGK